MFSFFTKKSQSFIILISRNLNQKFSDDTSDFVEIKGPVNGKLYLKQPKDGNVKFTVDKEELKDKVEKSIYDKLPEKMFFV